jgi:hypothetical protein
MLQQQLSMLEVGGVGTAVEKKNMILNRVMP